MPRLDVHRPSALNPADYRFVAFDYCRQVEAGDAPVDLSGCTWLQAEQETLRQDMVRTGGTWSNHAHGGVCMSCGNANAYYTATFHHAPSNSYVRVGSTCAHGINISLDHAAFQRFRNRVSSWLQRENRVPLAVAALESRGLGQLGQFCGAQESVPEDYTQRTIADIVYRLVANGSLSDRQWNYLAVLRDRWLNPQAAAIRSNQFAGVCQSCNQPVAPNVGRIERVDGRWRVYHLDGQCPQPEPTPAPVNTNVGELSGVMALFERARQHLQQPAVVLDVPEAGHPIRVSVAGERSRYHGQVIVLGEERGRGDRRPFLGVIDPQGNFQVTRYVPWAFSTAGSTAAVVARLRQFAENPAQVAGEYGRLHGRCCFCRLPLTDARSTAVGYGAICAGHYGLPWGERPAEFAAPVAATGGVVGRQRAMINQAMAQSTATLEAHRIVAEARQRPADWFQLAERPAAPRAPRTPPQLELNFDAGAEHARRANSGAECPACESTSIARHSPNSWCCHACGVIWEKQETPS